MYGNCVSNYSQWDCSDKTQNRTDSYCGWNNVCIASFEGNCTKWDYV